MSVTSIRLNPDIETPLEELATKLDRSKNYHINQAIREFVARQSMEEARWADTLEALQLMGALGYIASFRREGFQHNNTPPARKPVKTAWHELSRALAQD